MAKQDRSVADVEVLDYKWGQIITGAREALISAELVPRGHFPGDPGNNKVSLKYRTEATEVSVLRISRDRFQVRRDYPDAATRDAALERLSALERETNIKNHRARAKLPSPPIGHCTSLLARLSHRYPGIEVRDVRICPCGDSIQQSISFRGSVPDLKDAGLLTESMVGKAWGNKRGYGATTPIGDGYCLFGTESKADLTVYSETHPRRSPRTVRDAARVLRSFMLSPSRRSRARS